MSRSQPGFDGAPPEVLELLSRATDNPMHITPMMEAAAEEMRDAPFCSEEQMKWHRTHGLLLGRHALLVNQGFWL